MVQENSLANYQNKYTSFWGKNVLGVAFRGVFLVFSFGGPCLARQSFPLNSPAGGPGLEINSQPGVAAQEKSLYFDGDKKPVFAKKIRHAYTIPQQAAGSGYFFPYRWYGSWVVEARNRLRLPLHADKPEGVRMYVAFAWITIY